MALHSPSRSTWTFFGLAALFWGIAAATYVFGTILLFKARRSRRSQLDDGQDA